MWDMAEPRDHMTYASVPVNLGNICCGESENRLRLGDQMCQNFIHMPATPETRAQHGFIIGPCWHTV